VNEIQEVMNGKTAFCIMHVGPDQRQAKETHWHEQQRTLLDHPAMAPWERNKQTPADQMYAGAAEYTQRHSKQANYLAPYLGFGMYNSHGRFFTQPHVLQAVSTYLDDNNFVSARDHFIDFSAGSNEFAPLLASKTDCTFQSFDLFPAKVRQNLTLKSWFSVNANDVSYEGRGKEVVLGLNPPFGKDNIESRKFVAHGINVFQPRLLVLIVPDLGRMKELENYSLVHKDLRVVNGKDFYIPGAQTMGSKHQTNTDPAFIIYRRNFPPPPVPLHLQPPPYRSVSHAAVDPRLQAQGQAKVDRSLEPANAPDSMEQRQMARPAMYPVPPVPAHPAMPHAHSALQRGRHGSAPVGEDVTYIHDVEAGTQCPAPRTPPEHESSDWM